MTRLPFLLLVVGLQLPCGSKCFCQSPATSTFFKKQFTLAGNDLEPYFLATAKPGGFLIAGNYNVMGTNTVSPKTTCFIRVDENGCVQWARSLKTGEAQAVQYIIATSDGGFLISMFPFQAQNANYPTSLIVLKLDNNGDPAWSKRYSSGASVINYLSAITETTDHGYVLETGSFPAGSNPSFLSLFKIGQQGSFIWGNAMAMEDNTNYNVGGITISNGFIYGTGYISQAGPPYHRIRSFFTKLDEGTGKIIWTKQNDLESKMNFAEINNYKNGIVINCYDDDLQEHLIFSDTAGVVSKAITLNNPEGSLRSGDNILVTAGSDIYMQQSSGLSAVVRKEILLRLDSNQQIVWQHDYFDEDISFNALGQIRSTVSNGLVAGGYGTAKDGSKAIALIKIDSTGDFCQTKNTNLYISVYNTNLIPVNWNLSSRLIISTTDENAPVTDLSISAFLLCPKFITSCDSIKLQGPASVCKLSDTAHYLLSSDTTCGYPTFWTYDSNNISVITSTNYGLTVKFNKEGIYKIKALRNGCNLLADSLMVKAGNGTGVHLPGDTTLCPGMALTLDAGPGFNNYLWQNGSKEQIIHAIDPGTYWVKVQTIDGCNYVDTTIVRPGVRPANYLPADTSFCSSESITIQSTIPFRSYLWSTGETGRSIRVDKPGLYKLKVSGLNGCSGNDSINVRVRNCPFGIYFPNVFTPNKDGLNDEYRPVVIGNPEKFEFRIYSRTGQRIFETFDPKKGWDGTSAGTRLGNTVFAWVCIYQFNGQTKTTKKGTLLLIR